MDITVDVGEYKLNVRTAGIIMHNNKILVHSNLENKHYALLGGRIESGEDSEEAVKREILEETGKEIETIGYIGTIENFFKRGEEKYHEILFIHKAEFKNEEDKKIEYTLKNVEGKDYLQYEWIDINDIEKYPIRPQVIKEVLKQKEFPIHKIHRDGEI